MAGHDAETKNKYKLRTWSICGVIDIPFLRFFFSFLCSYSNDSESFRIDSNAEKKNVIGSLICDISKAKKKKTRNTPTIFLHQQTQPTDQPTNSKNKKIHSTEEQMPFFHAIENVRKCEAK